MCFRFLLASAFVLSLPVARAEPARELRSDLAASRATCKTNFIYDRERMDADHLADLCYVKSESKKPTSAVILVHGSNLCHRDMWHIGERLVQQGRVVMSIGYSADHCDGDVTKAVRWLRANAADYNIDPKLISLFGYSYGAMCSTWAALAYAHVRSVVVLSGAMTVERWWGLEGAPPFLFMHGKDDGVVHYDLAQEEHAAFLNHSLDSELVSFDTGGHHLAGLHMQEIADTTKRFLDRTLGRARSPMLCPECREEYWNTARENKVKADGAAPNADGYQTVLQCQDTDLMADFISRIVAHGGGRLDRTHKVADDSVMQLARWYSGENGARSFEELIAALRRMRWGLHTDSLDWVAKHHTAVPDNFFQQRTNHPTRAPLGAEQKAIHKRKAEAASLDKSGYQEVLALRDSEAMARFIARVIDQNGGFFDVSIDANVHGLAPWYSGEASANGFDSLLAELRRKPWALAPPGLKRAQVRRDVPLLCNTSGDADERVQQAPLNELGYECVAGLTDDGSMMHFIFRVIQHHGGLLTDKSMGSVGGLAHWYSGENGVQSYDRLLDELQHMDWALSPNAPRATEAPEAAAASAPMIMLASQHRTLRGTDSKNEMLNLSP